MAIICHLIIAIICIGFFLHTSSGDQLIFGKYSSNYSNFLSVITVAWMALSWWLWRHRNQLKPTVGNFVGVVLITALLALLILPGVYIYLHWQSLEKRLLAPVEAEAHAFFQIEKAPDFPKDTPKDSIKILALGGSTTYGARLERDETYPAVLERLLSSRLPEGKASVLNAGVPWHTSMHSLLRYVGRYSDWKPDIAIIMHAFNDIFQASEGRLTSGTFRKDYGHFFGALGERINPRDRFAAGISRILTSNWFSRTWYSDLTTPREMDPRKPVNLLRALPSFRRNLRELVRRAKQDGVYVIVTTQPYLYRDQMKDSEVKDLFYDYYYKDYALIPTRKQQRTAMDQFNAAVKQLSITENVKLVDLEAKVEKTVQMMYDDIHYTKLGAERVAQIIADSVYWYSFIRD